MIRVIVTLSLLLLAGTASAGRTLEVIEGAIEAVLGDVTMPGGSAGTLIIDGSCDDCEPQSLRATTDVRYYIHDTQLPRSEFMNEVDRLNATQQGQQTPVGIFYDRESERVTRIMLFTDPR